MSGGGKYIGANLSKYDHRQKQVAYEAIARRVRSAIDERDLTQTELCRMTGLSISAVQAIVQGNNVPLLALVQIARALKVSVDSFIPESLGA